MPDKKPTYQELEKLIEELKSEEKSKQSDARFSMLLKASEDMITVHEPNGKYIYYNGPKCYHITPEDIVGKMPNDLFKKDVAEVILNTFEKVIKSGESETVEVLLDWLGEKRWFSEYIYPIKNAEGKVVELVKVCRNIHRRKIAEQKIEAQNRELLEKQEELQAINTELHQINTELLFQKDEYRRLFDNATISIWNEDFTFVFEELDKLRKKNVTDIKTHLEQHPEVLFSLLTKLKVNSVNKATLKLFKAENSQEFIDNIHVIFGVGAEQVFINLVEAIWNKEMSFTSEVNYKTLKGDEFTALFSIHIPQTELEQRTVPVSIQSIQGIKDAEAGKRRSLKELNQAQKLSHVGSWQWNMATDEAEWSDEMYNIYGVTRDDFYPSNANVAKTILPEDLPKLNQGISSLLVDEMFIPFEFRIKRPSGEIRDLYIVALEKNDKNGVFGVTKDITDQKKIEGKLISVNKELEVFFYRTSHDLRAPLARIMGLLQIIEPSQSLKEIKSYLELIELSTFKLNNTLSDLIEIIQVRKGQLEKTEVDIEEVVDEIFDTHNSKKNYAIDVRKSFENKTIYTDLIYLKIVLRNLISNALKFSTDFRESYIFVESSRTDKIIQIKVEDNGIGIREEAKEHLFEMFYRGGNESSDGAGLGLFIVKDAINKLGGHIYFESEKNKGSTFYVELPLD